MADPVTRAREIERLEIGDAIVRSTARESIGRRLGDELIAAARETVGAWRQRENSQVRLAKAIARLEELVGKP